MNDLIYCPQCGIGSDLSSKDLVFDVWVCPLCQQSTPMGHIEEISEDVEEQP